MFQISSIQEKGRPQSSSNLSHFAPLSSITEISTDIFESGLAETLIVMGR